jgi:hypothetical protein
MTLLYMTIKDLLLVQTPDLVVGAGRGRFGDFV